MGLRNDNPIPQSYSEWRHCITVDCGLALTREYIHERLHALHDSANSHTQRIIALYGAEHHRRLIEWFELAQQQQD